jgi:hypothetical protein
MGTGTGSIDLSTLNNLHGNLTQHFWFNSNTGVAYGTGVHITLSSQAEFIASPTGQNILMNTDGISIRNGTIPLMVLDNDSLDFNVITNLTQGTYSNVATFGATGFRMGAIADGETRLIANGAGVDLIRREGTSDTTLAHFGYDYGTPEQSGHPQVQNPYYTFGYRSPNYDVGNWSVAEGNWTVASGFASHAEGSESTASGLASHAEGVRTVASGSASHAGGWETEASADQSFTHGYQVQADFNQEFVIGRFNNTSLTPYINTIYVCDENDYDKATLTFPNTYGNYEEDFNVTYNGNFLPSPQCIYVTSTTITIVAAPLSSSGDGHFEDGDEIGIILSANFPAFVIGNGDATHKSNALSIRRNGDVHANGDVYAWCNADSSGGTNISQAVLDLVPVQISYQNANTTVITAIGGSVHSFRLPNGQYIVYFSFGFKTSQNRTNSAVFRIISNGHVLGAINPYFIPCTVDGAFRYSYGNMSGSWWEAPGTWSANTEFRISGTVLMYDTGISV